MRRITMIAGTLVMLMLAAPIAYAQQQTGEKRCLPSDDIEVAGSIKHVNRKKAVLSGNAINHSQMVEYENARIGAELFNQENRLVGYVEFTVEEDIDADESEAFRLDLRDAEDVAFVKYKLICATRPVIEP